MHGPLHWVDGLRTGGAVHGFGIGHLVDDALDDDDLNVDVTGDIGQELVDKVSDGRGGHGDAIALGGGRSVGLAAGHIEVGDLILNGESDEVGVVEHALAAVGLGPEDLEGGVAHAMADGAAFKAVVMRVLVGEGGDGEGAEEFAGYVLGKTDADVARIAGHAGTVGGMGVSGNGDGRYAADGDDVEGVDDVAHGKPAFVARSERLFRGSVGEALIPVEVFGSAGDVAGVDAAIFPARRGRG